MKKLSAILMAFLLLVCSSPSFASVGVKVDNALKGTATDLKFNNRSATNQVITGEGSFNLILAGGGTSGATSMTSLQKDVLPGYSFIRKDIASDSAFNAGTMANGTPGQLLTLYITVRQGSGTFTLTPTTKTGFTNIAFDAVGDTATFLYVDDTTGWVIFSQTACTITQP